jgi:hypothetical protein
MKFERMLSVGSLVRRRVWMPRLTGYLIETCQSEIAKAVCAVKTFETMPE